MKNIPFYAVCNHDVNANGIVCINQLWTAENNGFSYVNSPRSNHGLLLVVGGEVVYSEKNEKITVALPGDILYLPKGAYYLMNAPKNPTRTQLVNFRLFDRFGNEINLSDSILKIKGSANTDTSELFSKLCGAYSTTSNQLKIKSDFFELFNLIVSQSNTEENIPPVLPAVTYINNHLNENVKIPDLAKMCAMSESMFRREFIRFNSVSPKKYIIAQKINKARQMLQNSDASMTEIYSALGFCDLSHFFKVFKQISGETPASYKAQTKQSENSTI